MIRIDRNETNPLLLWRRAVPLVLVTALLAGTLPTASAIGKRAKPWERGVRAQPTSQASGNTASSTTKKRSLFGRLRDQRVKRSATVNRAPKPSPAIEVRATARTAKPQRKKRAGLLARIFKPEPLKARTPAGNVAAERKRRPSGPAAPNAVQAAPKYDQALISQARSRGSNVVVNIARQRAYVYVGGEVAIDTPISTARPGKHTPRGSFAVGERVRQGKISTIYDVAMPYWMRLGATPYGMHAGYLPGYPASAGCIRMPYEAAQKVFDATSYGTRVRITGG